MDKAKLRKQIRALKAKYNASAWTDSVLIMQTLEADEHFRSSKTVLLYHSLSDEVNTHTFIDKWCGQKLVLLPKVVDDDLELRIYHNASELQVGAFGISEPTGKLFTDYAQIDFVAVPGIAFDTKGNRLGRGKGYYDRLLPKLTNAYKAGICFPYQLVETVPTEPTDIKMDVVITLTT
jgi:5-formyltetrahydrofolate cyclo-ligase